MTMRSFRGRVTAPKTWVLMAVTACVLSGWVSPAWAGAWVLPKGKNRVQFGVLFQRTDERYFLDKERIPYFFDGESRAAAVFLSLRRSVVDRLEISAQLSFWDINFDDFADERRSTGIGDLRVGVRYNFLRKPLVATISSKVKFPTGEFVNDAEVVPVGEGQYDVEFALELGRSLWPRPGYVSVKGGYRLRTENADTRINPGEEFFWAAEVGYRPVKKVMVKLLSRGLHGGRSTSFGLGIATLRRKAVYFTPGVIVDLGGSARTVEFSVPITLAGRNWPAGVAFGLGFAQRF